MSKDKDAKRKRAEKTSVSRDSGDIRKTLSGERRVSSLELRSCQQERRSRFRDAKGKPDQEKVASSDKNVKRKKIREKEFREMTQSTAVTTMRRSYRPSLFFIAPLSKFPSLSHPVCPGFTANITYFYFFICWFLIILYYIHIYIYKRHLYWHVTTHGSHPEVVTCRASFPSTHWKIKKHESWNVLQIDGIYCLYLFEMSWPVQTYLGLSGLICQPSRH